MDDCPSFFFPVQQFALNAIFKSCTIIVQAGSTIFQFTMSSQLVGPSSLTKANWKLYAKGAFQPAAYLSVNPNGKVDYVANGEFPNSHGYLQQLNVEPNLQIIGGEVVDLQPIFYF